MSLRSDLHDFTRYHPAVKFDLVGRRCIVTGATSGIGKEIARNLAYFGATLVIASRDRERGSAVLQELVEDSGNDQITMFQVDLASPESIVAFSRNVIAGGKPVHVLVNNAGMYAPTKETVRDGVERTWATNVLGPFALTNRLLPTLVRNSPSRVVNVASKLAGGLRLDDLNFEKRRYSGTKAYKQSKQANRMLSWGLQRRVGDQISVTACHPGGVNTRIYDATQGITGVLASVARKFMKTPAEGARTPTLLAADPNLADLRGEFWVDEAKAARKFDAAAPIDALWDRCAEMTGTDL